MGKPWTEQLGSNTVEFTIPEGNGRNTVDAVVRDAAGNQLSRARIVAIEGTGKYKRWEAGGYAYLVIDGDDVREADPPVWLIVETGEVSQVTASITEWFSSLASGVLEKKSVMKARRSAGMDSGMDRYFQ
ncbi:hypothetical protein APR08_005179 [Nocardia amikacinitolerans]|nr:hypothetical protein [Nocardia amikacinitolerans]